MTLISSAENKDHTDLVVRELASEYTANHNYLRRVLITMQKSHLHVRSTVGFSILYDTKPCDD